MLRSMMARAHLEAQLNEKVENINNGLMGDSRQSAAQQWRDAVVQE